MKPLKSLISICLLLLTFNLRVFAAEDTVYLTDQAESPIQQVQFSDSQIYLTINLDSQDGRGLIIRLLNATDAVTSQLNPEANQADIEKKQKELGLDYQSKKDLLDIQDNTRVSEVIDQLESLTPGIYPYFSKDGQVILKISQADIKKDDQKLIISLFNNPLLEFNLENDSLIYDDVTLNKE
ncbi:hypothetical protein [Facklamia hominis]|uniref:Uncharacterized protein n=1 Tax=Facklamia hominis CCUG 36813 TaxID=883111 RepID=K1LT72_9LACT|nr:hypothetical protein [Facklamia hominis]EKB55252.1 hypothetical protein HMPREF9706_00607 [Facklamia hominis CCUG 36813]EPH12504.1 hypothetical protein HMPREF9260_00618 [Facklamia hominis ACS-120-V-Sch10]PKY92411.1 hypothetical protein CYJ56_08230 [Facklamia hominis]